MADDSLPPLPADAPASLFPTAPHLFAGAVGGPFVITSLTPLRNAMSNAAQDSKATFGQLYSKVGGPMTRGMLTRVQVAYTGAAVSALPACPQWCVIGPAFHAFHTLLPTPIALRATAHLETFLVYGSQTRNAQLAHNVQVAASASGGPDASTATAQVKPSQLSRVWRPWGPGAGFFALRNACGMSGIRWLSPPCQSALEGVLPSGPREIVADMAASMVTCLVSAPLNACWVYSVTTPSLWGMPSAQRLTLTLDYLKRQYLDPTGRRVFSRLAMRDLGVRCVYISACFSMFSAIERLAVAYWPRPRDAAE